MDNQEIFDTVVRHLRVLPHKSVDNDRCVYRSDDGSACAIGCLLTDNEAMSFDKIIRSDVRSLAQNRFLPSRLGGDLKGVEKKNRVNLLEQLQYTHDSDGVWVRDDLINETEARRLFLAIAHKFSLSTAVLDECFSAKGEDDA